jgi:ABC-type branched-subunit amino acid transport system substrate-binding protein
LGKLFDPETSHADFSHGTTNMKTATEFDDQESLPVPDSHILAIVANSDEAKAIVETLNANGFSPDEIGILTGATDAERLDAATGKKGLFAKIVTSGIDMGDRNTDYFKQYRNFCWLVELSWES